MYENLHNPSTDLFTDEPIIYGSFWERFGASLIDGIILMVPYYIIEYNLNEVAGFISNVLINWIYYAVQESGTQQATFGKRALGLKVTSMNGHRISFGTATGRFFGKFISYIILCWGFLMMIWDDKKQTLHDKMAGTLVVK